MTRIFDGDLNFAGGQNNGRAPHLLQNGEYASGINISNRHGTIEPRESLRHVSLETNIPGTFQGAVAYRPGALGRLVVACGGHLYQVYRNGRTVQITDDSTHLDSGVDEIYMVQGDRLLLVSDGTNRPVVIDDEKLSEADQTMFPGRWMAYGAGRVFQVSYDRTQVLASDIYAPVNSGPEVLHRYTESPVGFAPYGIGKITGIAFLPILDNGTGLGALIVTGQRGIYAFDVGRSRDLWTEPGFGRLVVGNAAVLSHRSLIDINGDLFFRRAEGIGSLVSARTDWQTPLNRSLSYEVRGWLDEDDKEMLSSCSASYVDHKLRMTFAPEKVDDEIRFRGIIAMDLDADSGLKRGLVTYPGIETGTNPLQLVDDWLLSRDDDGVFRVFVLSTECDDIGDANPFLSQGATQPIKQELVTRAYDFQQPLIPKQMSGQCYLDFSGIRGKELKVTIEFRPDNYPGWLPWVKKRIDLSTECHGSKVAYARLPLGLPDDDGEMINPMTKRSSFEFARVQLRLTIEGHASLDQIRLSAEVGNEDADHIDDAYLADVVPEGPVVDCTHSPFTYRVSHHG